MKEKMMRWLPTVALCISNIYSNVDEQLEKEASQLADSGWELSDVDVDARKAVVECSVTPKVYENGNGSGKLLYPPEF